MSSMTHKAMSDCSYPESENQDIKSHISKVYQRLMAVMKEEADLRRDLEELLNRQEMEAMEELKKTEENVALIKAEGEQMRKQLQQAEEHARVRVDPFLSPNSGNNQLRRYTGPFSNARRLSLSSYGHIPIRRGTHSWSK
jgi:chromosome segregation ATPase